MMFRDLRESRNAPANLRASHTECERSELPAIARQVQRSLRGAVETHDAGQAIPEAGGLIEGGEFRFEIDVQPLASPVACVRRSSSYEFEANALASKGDIDSGIEEKGVLAAIRGEVDVADKLFSDEGPEIGETTAEHGLISAR